MQKDASSADGAATQARDVHALIALCAGVLPVWGRHLAASRAQSEVAVTQMLQAFSDIGPHINMAERQSQQITDALSQSDGGVTGLVRACERTLAPLLQDPQLPAGGAAALEHVLTMVRSAVNALEQITKPFSHETQMVAEQVERMYIGFQYQDRISQMMGLLEGDIARLQEAFDGKVMLATDLQGWLARLEAQYAMAEQRDNHSATSPQGAKPGGDSNETTFF
jgi:ABC-type transporter Mla subunit MlaD